MFPAGPKRFKMSVNGPGCIAAKGSVGMAVGDALDCTKTF